MIIFSSLTTPDGTELVSRSRHNFVSHTDANGKYYFIDGGSSYTRSSANGDEHFTTLYISSPLATLREHLAWGTRGPAGDQPVSYIKLKDLATDHLTILVDTYLPKNHLWYRAFSAELFNRKSLPSDTS